MLSTDARCLVITLGGQCNMVDFTSNQIKFICDKNKHNVTHKKQSSQVCQQDTKAAWNCTNMKQRRAVHRGVSRYTCWKLCMNRDRSVNMRVCYLQSEDKSVQIRWCCLRRLPSPPFFLRMSTRVKTSVWRHLWPATILRIRRNGIRRRHARRQQHV